MMAVLQDSCEFQSVVREVILGAGLQIEGRKIAVNYKAIDIKIGGDANSFLQRWKVAFRIVYPIAVPCTPPSKRYMPLHPAMARMWAVP